MRIQDRALWFSLVLVLAFAALLLPGCASIPESAKPDVHLTFDIHADGSNTIMLEAAVHPLVDPLLGPAMTEAKRIIAEEPSASVLLTETKRDGRAYNALVVGFNSIGDLNAFMNTPQLLKGILGPVAPDVTIPSPFAEFEAWHDPENRDQPYGLTALLDPATTSALSGIKLTTHVILPGGSSGHNASSVANRVLNWDMVPGDALQIYAVADGAAGLDPKLLLVVAGGALAVIAFIGLAIWAMQRRRSRNKDEIEFGMVDGW